MYRQPTACSNDISSNNDASPPNLRCKYNSFHLLNKLNLDLLQPTRTCSVRSQSRAMACRQPLMHWPESFLKYPFMVFRYCCITCMITHIFCKHRSEARGLYYACVGPCTFWVIFVLRQGSKSENQNGWSDCPLTLGMRILLSCTASLVAQSEFGWVLLSSAARLKLSASHHPHIPRSKLVPIQCRHRTSKIDLPSNTRSSSRVTVVKDFHESHLKNVTGSKASARVDVRHPEYCQT